MTFRLALKVEGPNPLYWESIDLLIGQADIPAKPEWSFTPQAEVFQCLAGGSFPRGFASAAWHWNILNAEQRAILKEFCPASSAEVYIETATNEIDFYGDIVFIQALAIMHWPRADEDLQINKVLGLDLLFTHLEEV